MLKTQEKTLLFRSLSSTAAPAKKSRGYLDLSNKSLGQKLFFDYHKFNNLIKHIPYKINHLNLANNNLHILLLATPASLHHMPLHITTVTLSISYEDAKVIPLLPDSVDTLHLSCPPYDPKNSNYTEFLFKNLYKVAEKLKPNITSLSCIDILKHVKKTKENLRLFKKFIDLLPQQVTHLNLQWNNLGFFPEAHSLLQHINCKKYLLKVNLSDNFLNKCRSLSENDITALLDSHIKINLNNNNLEFIREVTLPDIHQEVINKLHLNILG